MSEVKVNKISPRTACGTVTLGDSGDTFTIPSGATITNSGTASGFGATGEISWNTTVKTTGTFTATAGVGYFLNTTGGIITVNLPAGTAGDSVAMVDYAGTWDTNAVTVTPNGSEKIGGIASSASLFTEGQSVTFVYIDGTQGWVNVLDSTSNVQGQTYITATGGTPCAGATCGNYKIHTFTGPGTFCVSSISTSAPNNEVSYIVVGAGGSSGGYYGGGGAGGFRESKSPVDSYTASPLEGACAVTVSCSPGAYAVVIGGGGASATNGTNQGNSGNLASALGISSAGGGFGSGVPAGPAAGSGGSGGGEGYVNAGGAGSGNTPPTSPPQGKDGGAGAPGEGGGGGGGGATVAGTAGDPAGSIGGAGGTGATTSISGSPTAYAGGGGAGASTTGGAGGAGGGGTGQGSNLAGQPAQTGGVNTGGGGGARGDCGSGGSGVVIIRYKFQ